MPRASMGQEGMDTKYKRGKYPREDWPWHRADPHLDTLSFDWARPDQWYIDDYLYNAVNKLNTSIYQLYAFHSQICCFRSQPYLTSGTLSYSILWGAGVS